MTADIRVPFLNLLKLPHAWLLLRV